MWPIRANRHTTSLRAMILGFLLVILAGSVLLMLPISTREGVRTPFLETLFTSTSAVCVTGLVIHDTATYWSAFGQLVILLLIQIGGLGVVTVAGAFAILSGRRIGLMQRIVTLNSPPLTRFITMLKTLNTATIAPHMISLPAFSLCLLCLTPLIPAISWQIPPTSVRNSAAQ